MKPKNLIRILLISIMCISITTVNAQGNKNRQAQKQKHQKVKKHAPHYRYTQLPRWGYSTKEAPKNALIIAHAGAKYHYHSGIFYKRTGVNYKIAKAPIGIRVQTLPKGNIHFILGTRKYFYYYGTYYVKSDVNSEYVIVAAPKGAIIDALPEGYREGEIDGNEYYEFEGVYYKPIINDNNEEWYEVVGDI